MAVLLSAQMGCAFYQLDIMAFGSRGVLKIPKTTKGEMSKWSNRMSVVQMILWFYVIQTFLKRAKKLWVKQACLKDIGALIPSLDDYQESAANLDIENEEILFRKTYVKDRYHWQTTGKYPLRTKREYELIDEDDQKHYTKRTVTRLNTQEKLSILPSVNYMDKVTLKTIGDLRTLFFNHWQGQ
jgi:hypothetical protein